MDFNRFFGWIGRVRDGAVNSITVGWRSVRDSGRGHGNLGHQRIFSPTSTGTENCRRPDSSMFSVNSDCCGIQRHSIGGNSTHTVGRALSIIREYRSMKPISVISLISIAEQLATIIAQEVNASNTPEEQVAWTAAQQFYLQGLAALKAKVQAQTTTAAPVA